MADRTYLAAIAIMVGGLVAMTIVPDVTEAVTTAEQRVGLVVVGGLVAFGVSSWMYYDIDRGDKMDERYVKIFLRAAFLAWWGTVWLLLTADLVLEDLDSSVPVDSLFTVVSVASLGLFVVVGLVFERLM